MKRASVKAVFFDVDFTLIYPGPTFQGVGYEQFCARYGIGVDIDRFADAVRAASSVLEQEHDQLYDPAIFVRYTRTIIEGMGGRGDRLDSCAEEIYAEWAACRHFELYDDVAPTLKELSSRGIRMGLDFQFPSLPGFVPDAFRAGWADRWRVVVGGAWLHEATPEHLRIRTGPAWCHSRGIGDGWRQPVARYRRRTPGWDAWHPRAALDR